MGAYTAFGNFIRTSRDQAGLGLRQAARELGISPSYLSRLEAGEFRPPSGPVMHRIARAYRVDIKLLMDRAKQRQHEVMEADEGVAPAVQAFYRLAHDQTPEVREKMLEGAIGALDLSDDQREVLIERLKAMLNRRDLPRRARGKDDLYAIDIRPRVLSREWIASFATKVLQEVFGSEIPLPVPLDSVVSRYDRDVVLIGRDDLEGGRLKDGSPAVLGLSRWSRDGSRRELIVHSDLLDSDDPASRRRANFTIAHELFHCLEHLPLSQPNCTEAVLARRPAYVTLSSCLVRKRWCHGDARPRRLSTHEDWREWQANQFAAELLMPEAAVRSAVLELFGVAQLVAQENEVREFADEVVRIKEMDDFGRHVSLVDRFDVNPQCMAIRMISLGLVASVV